MGLNPMIYIVVTAICAGISVFTAFLALRANRKESDEEVRRAVEMAAKAVGRERAKESESTVHAATLQDSPRFDQLMEAARATSQQATGGVLEQLLAGGRKQSVVSRRFQPHVSDLEKAARM